MDTKKETKRKPRGLVRCWYRPDRPNQPYYLQWRVGGKKPAESFKNKDDRDRRAKDLRDQGKANLLGEVPTREEINDYRAFKRAIGDADWRDVVQDWRKMGSTSSLKVEDMYAAYEQWQRERMKAKKLTEHVMARQLKVAKAFADDHEGRKAKDLTKEGLIDWIEGHYDDTPAPTTFNRALRILRTMWARSKELNNLFKEIETWDDTAAKEKIRILPVADAELLFAYGLTEVPWLMPKIAIEAFVGARFRTAALLSESLIDVPNKAITFPAKIIKTKKQQRVEVIKDNLWSWIQLATPQTWSLTERQYLTQKSRLFELSGVPHPHNCLRHSAASYHASAFQDMGKTALMLCHVGIQQLWDTYKNPAWAADGHRYYNITVETIRAKLASGEIKLPDKTQAASSP